MNILKNLTSGKCLKIWLLSFLGMSVFEYAYFFFVAKVYTPDEFLACQRETWFMIAAWIYLTFFSLPISVLANVHSRNEKKRLFYIVSIFLILWSLAGVIGILILLATQ